jgi:hypothetical protein
LRVFPEFEPKGHGFNRDFVLHVKTGTDCQLNNKIYSTGLLILSKARHDRLGYALYPEYEGMWSDVEFWLHADADNAIIDATSLTFTHHHPIVGLSPAEFSKGDWKYADAVYAEQNKSSAYLIGREIFERRERSLWGQRPADVKPKVFVCLPGEWFDYRWVSAVISLLFGLNEKYDLMSPCFLASSNVYITRQAMADAVLQQDPKPDYVLWIDDDNILSFEHFETLMADLVAHPEAGAIFGWTWAQPNQTSAPATLSCGMFDERNVCYPVMIETFARALEAHSLLEVGYSGFPAVLMRYDTLVKCGKAPFAPRMVDEYAWGFMGEDASFCLNGKERAGLRWYVEPRVQVPHLKTVDIGGVPLPPLAELEAAAVGKTKGLARSPGGKGEK